MRGRGRPGGTEPERLGTDGAKGRGWGLGKRQIQRDSDRKGRGRDKREKSQKGETWLESQSREMKNDPKLVGQLEWRESRQSPQRGAANRILQSGAGASRRGGWARELKGQRLSTQGKERWRQGPPWRELPMRQVQRKDREE